MSLEVELFNKLFEYKEGQVCRRYGVSGHAAGPVSPHMCKGYLALWVQGKRKSLHRIIYALVHKELPKVVDHIDGNPLNNTLENLRAATYAVNSQNQRPKKSRELPMGVQRGHKSPNYTAWITLKGKTTYLGTYKTPEEAHQVYLKAKREYHEGCTI